MASKIARFQTLMPYWKPTLDDQDQKSEREHPGELVAMAAPIAARADPESGQQILFADLFGFFRREFRIGLDDLGRRRLHLITVFGDDLDDFRLLFARLLVAVRLLIFAWILIIAWILVV